MASNLSCIGFDFADADAFQAGMLACAGDADERVGCPAGDYSIWSSPTGAQIWFQIEPFGTEDDVRDIAGLTPFFEGTSVVEAEIVARIARAGDNAFEGVLEARVGGPEGYPLLFDAVDFAVHTDLALPIRCRVRITGFARGVRAYADEQSFMAAQAKRGGLPIGAQAFVPIGAFQADADEPAEPTSEALLTGRITEHHELVNEATGKPFHWLVVEGLGGSFDIVAAPGDIDGRIVTGGTLEVGCFLFGRLIGGPQVP